MLFCLLWLCLGCLVLPLFVLLGFWLRICPDLNCRFLGGLGFVFLFACLWFTCYASVSVSDVVPCCICALDCALCFCFCCLRVFCDVGLVSFVESEYRGFGCFGCLLICVFECFGNFEFGLCWWFGGFSRLVFLVAWVFV